MLENVETLLKHFGRTFQEGEHIFFEGDTGTELYLVHSGEVRIYKTIKDRERTLFIMKKDDFFGEVAALTGTPRTASAVAMGETTLIVIPVAIMEKITENSPEVATKLLKRMAWRLKAADDLVGILMEGDPQVRVVLGIIRLMEIGGVMTDEGVSFRIDPGDFASQIDVDAGDITSVVDQLAGKGIIEFMGDGTVMVRNPDELEEFYRFLELARKFGQK
jgi:CRP/FNR family cyclic AMP-dependent transcriptional regulator